MDGGPHSVAGWLPAWMSQQLDLGAVQPAILPAILAPLAAQAMYLYGSIGVDTALASTGQVFVSEYELDPSDGPAQPVSWREAQGLERVGFIVLGARRFAQLHALLPARSPDAPPCDACRGTGDWHIFSGDRKESLRISGMICKDCGGLGWRAPTRG